jgi:mannose-6-phosphate isomerase-like protein (cupin superfamily)
MPVRRFRFQARSGYIVGPENTTHALLALGHSLMARPWSDPGLHLHSAAEEFYFVRNGEVWLSVGGERVSVRANEILMVRPSVPHAVLGGLAPIEHFGFRAPSTADKQPVAAEAPGSAVGEEGVRDLRRAWGCRVALHAAEHQNCWVFGQGAAQFEAQHLALAYLNFATREAANAGLGTRHRLHYHERAWEYYAVLQGRKTLRVEDELVDIEAGEIVEVPPGVKHALYGRQAPFEGFTIRVPVELHDKVGP